MHQCSPMMQNQQSFMWDWLQGTTGALLPSQRTSAACANQAEEEQIKRTMIEAEIDSLPQSHQCLEGQDEASSVYSDHDQNRCGH